MNSLMKQYISLKINVLIIYLRIIIIVIVDGYTLKVILEPMHVFGSGVKY